jgi:hypothetical protein
MTLSRAVSAFVCVLLLAGLLVAGDKKKDSGQVATIKVVVLKDDTGKPVRNAAVIFHNVGEHGKQSRGGMELKTDVEGKTGCDGIPYGTLRVQVIAPGFQTFGQDYAIDQPEPKLTIRLKRPQPQYSIYDKH